MAPGPELALEDAAVPRELGEGGEHGRLARRVAAGDVDRGERPVGAGVARDDLAQRVGLALEEGPGEALRRGDAERVAQPAGVLGRGPPLLAGHVDPDRPPLPLELGEPGPGRSHGVALRQRPHARGRLFPREVAEAEQQVVQPLGARGLARRVEALQRRLELGEGVAVEELAQLRLAEQLAQLRLVDGEGLGPPLGERRVALVEVVRDVAEEERGREGRGRLRVDRDEADLAAAHAAGEVHEAGQVEHVPQALAVGLEDDREGGVARGHLQQVVRALPLHP